MKNYLFEKGDLDLIKNLMDQNPKRIWWESNRYIFEYVTFFIELEVNLAEKFQINTVLISEIGASSIEQYILSANFNKSDSRFTPSEIAKSICEDEKISNISIVRTRHCFIKPIQIAKDISHFQNNSYQTNPSLKTNPNLEKQCLVDVGVTIELENGKTLNCFIIENDEDFELNDFHGHDNPELRNENLYEFIEINAS